MSHKSLTQRKRLFGLACTILKEDKPLGVGLKNGCWAGVAIQTARRRGQKVTDFYGLSMREVKEQIKRNNKTPAEKRNSVMARKTLRLAFS